MHAPLFFETVYMPAVNELFEFFSDNAIELCFISITNLPHHKLLVKFSTAFMDCCLSDFSAHF